MNGPNCSCVAPCTYTMFGRSFAKHVHFVVWHEQWKIHGGMVLSWEMPPLLPAFVSM